MAVTVVSLAMLVDELAGTIEATLIEPDPDEPLKRSDRNRGSLEDPLPAVVLLQETAIMETSDSTIALMVFIGLYPYNE